MPDSARDKVTRSLADYLPHSPASANIEDRRDHDPTLRQLGIEALKARAKSKGAKTRMDSDIGSAEIVDMMVPRGNGK